MSRDRLVRVVSLGLCLLIGLFLAWETLGLARIIGDQGAIGTDLQYYRFVAERWLTTGVLYIPEQLAGPYVVETQVHNLYPPHALYLFVPFLYLPDILWYVVPLGILAYIVWWCRPAIWSWPVLLLLLALPKGPAQILFGNTDMWIAAFVAGAVRWSWPGVLVSIKPSLALFGAVGVLSRRWWIAAAVLGLLSLPFWRTGRSSSRSRSTRAPTSRGPSGTTRSCSSRSWPGCARPDAAIRRSRAGSSR